MTLSEFAAVLTSSTLPVAYDHFPEESDQALPCITYQEAYTSNFAAGNKVYQKVIHLDVFLWTATKDPTTEGLLEGAFDTNEIVWDLESEEFDRQDLCYKRIYEVSIYG